jgi:hypothetical protein
VFSGVRASFVRRWPFKPFNRCAPFKPFKPTRALRVQSSNTRYPVVVKSILDFGFRPNQRSNLRNQFAMRPFFRSSSSQTKFRLPLELLLTTVHLTPTTHPEERSLAAGDELAESPLISKSRITQIVRKSITR